MSFSMQPAWLTALRKKSAEDVARLGFPGRKHERWKHVSARDLLPSTTALPSHELASFAEDFSAPEAWAVLVFAGGIFRPDLSRLPETSRSWNVEPLSLALDFRGSDIISRLGTADPSDHPLMALNLERWTDGLFLRVSEGVELPGPVQILEIGSGSSWVRHLVALEPGAQATLLETHLSPEGVPTSTHSVTEARLPKGAKLRHVRVQRNSPASRSWSAMALHLGEDASVEATHFNVGNTVSRCEIHADLDQPGADLSITGLAAATSDDVLDALTAVRHLAPRCTSAQTWKTIAQGSSKSNFVGEVHVAPGADGTQARQQSRNIVLAREATVHARPQLEIWADDVQCSHGSATGRLDEKAMFFLRSRGLDSRAARAVLVKAFASEVIDTIPWASVRSDLEALIEGRI
ncbi:MAG: Fe-S cluster assembly protein SufD [Fibrobacteria bacterium]|nr:Fe-S cluster assembly protein SufD [Fibrobacteria bacterium]